MKRLEPHILIRNLLIEIIVYSVLIFIYYLMGLRWLDDWLFSIFKSNIAIYSIIGLGLIITQAVLLDFVTLFLLRYIKLDQFGLRRLLDVFPNR